MAAVAILCPACGKANQGGPTCPRCGCALEALLRVAAAAERAAAEAHRLLEMRDWAAARAAADRSWRMRRSARSARIAFLAAAAAGDSPGAAQWRARGRARSAEPS